MSHTNNATDRLRVAVLFGGRSSEYDVSLQSAYAVIGALRPERYDVTLVGITRDGAWLQFAGPLTAIRDDTWHRHPSCVPAFISPDRRSPGIWVMDGNGAASGEEAGTGPLANMGPLADAGPAAPTGPAAPAGRLLPVDVVFPALHGKNGEDGTVQGLLELAGIPYVGCGVLSSALCMDKDVAHRLVRAAGVKTARSVVLYEPPAEADLLQRTDGMSYPLFVKPANAGSSLGISRVTAPSGLLLAVSAAFAHDRKVVIEEAVAGFEVGCAVIGNDSLTVGEVDEIELQGGFFDHTEKYSLQSARIHTPARIDAEIAERVKATAVAIYRALQCRGLARIDLFVTPEREIVFNEVNTMPGFTPQSRFPRMLEAAGLSFADIVDRVIALAVAA